GAAHLLGLIGIGGNPALDAIHRHLFARDEIAVDEDAPDGSVAMAVVGIVVEPQQSAILEPHPNRALDLDRHSLPRIADIADLELLAVKRALLDGEAIMIGLQFLLVIEAPDRGPGA